MQKHDFGEISGITPNKHSALVSVSQEETYAINHTNDDI